jgi:hypothetical protein
MTILRCALPPRWISARSPLDVALLAFACALLPACLEPVPIDLPARPPEDAGTDAADAAPRVGLGELTVQDGRREPRLPTEIPRRPTLRLAIDGAAVAPEAAIFLLHRAPDDALLADLASAPLRSENLARVVPLTLHADPDAVFIRPIDALVAGADYALCVAAWLLDANGARVLGAPRAIALRVSTSPDDGAVRVDSWPADGAPGVGPNLALLGLRFDGRVVGAIDAVFLAGPDGIPVPGQVREPSCTELGWPDGHCVTVVPYQPLLRGAAYALVAGEGLRDGAGASLGRSESHFTTSAEDDASAPTPAIDETCAPDETTLEDGACLLADDRSLSLRVRTLEPVRAFFAVTEGGRSRVAGTVAPRGEVALALRSLPAETTLDATLRLVDAAGLEIERRWSVATTAPLATLSITEVRADPRGPEPRQEYVEVLNFGAVPVDLRGFSLSDRADVAGDLLTRSFLLPAGARALFVADAFDPADARDDVPAPGVPLVFLGTSIGSGGLSSSGEALFLRDADGRRVSASPALAPRAPGACIVRASDDPRDGALAAFGPDALAGCTPGLPDRVAGP